MIRHGQFREDLFYRLNVVPIYIPPLRERIEDIYPLAERFLALISRSCKVQKQLTPSAIQALADYIWPGNVRELYNVMERLVVLYPQIKITKEHVLEELSPNLSQKNTIMPDAHKRGFKKIMSTFEKDLLHQTIKQHKGNLQSAAAALGMHRTTLLRKLNKHKSMV